MKLILVRGLPGSGKTTYVNRNFPTRYIHLEADHFRTDCRGHYLYDPAKNGICHRLCQDYAEMALSQGKDVVISNTFTTIKEMQYYISLASAYGADLRVITCRGKFQNVHDVPEKAMEAMRKRWQDYPGEEFIDHDKPICFGHIDECNLRFKPGCGYARECEKEFEYRLTHFGV